MGGHCAAHRDLVIQSALLLVVCASPVCPVLRMQSCVTLMESHQWQVLPFVDAFSCFHLMASDLSSLSVIPDERYERLVGELMQLREAISQVLGLQQILNGNTVTMLRMLQSSLQTASSSAPAPLPSACAQIPNGQCCNAVRAPQGQNSGLTVVPKPPPCCADATLSPREACGSLLAFLICASSCACHIDSFDGPYWSCHGARVHLPSDS
eukprot:1147469-Amphidinium_carterae.1